MWRVPSSVSGISCVKGLEVAVLGRISAHDLGEEPPISVDNTGPDRAMISIYVSFEFVFS